MQIMQKYRSAILVLAMVPFFSTFAQAAFLPICSRTPAVKDFIEIAVKKTCKEISAEDLLTIKRITVAGKGIPLFQVDDFTGLTNLEILNIRSNPYTDLPEGLLRDLIHLKTIVIISTKLSHFPDDFLADNPEIENVHTFRNGMKTITESVFRRMENAKNLKVIDVDNTIQQAEKERLIRAFPANGPVDVIFN